MKVDVGDLSRRVMRRLVLAGVVAGLAAGCAAPTPVRDLQADAWIKTVAVVPMLKEDAQVRRLGLTVFNNDEAVVAAQAGFNQLAVATVEARLRQARPAWRIVQAQANSAELADKFASRVLTGSLTAKVQGDLAAIAQRTGADVLFVVGEGQRENLTGRGVGAILRALPGVQPKLQVHAYVSVLMVDKQGELISGRSGGVKEVLFMPAADVGLSGDLVSLDVGDTRVKVMETLRQRLVTVLQVASESMGY